MSMYEKALDYVDQGLMTRRTLQNIDDEYEIFCYSRDTFLSGDWDEVTTTHRGKVYRNGKPINHVFPKIFNLNETVATSLPVVEELMSEYPVMVFDKVNGHLSILTHDVENGCWLISTKGSLDSEMIDNDREVYRARGYEDRFKDLPVGCTLMFEALTDADPHTLHQKQKDMYSQNGEDVMVLLGGYDREGNPFTYPEMTVLADLLGCPVVKVYDPNEIDTDNILSLLDHTDIEGYVFWFPEHDFRVKIKTHEYWQMRVKKDLTPERLVRLYCNQGPDALLRKLPEEYDEQLLNLVKETAEYWYTIEHVRAQQLRVVHYHLEGRELFTSYELTHEQKVYIDKLQKYYRSDKEGRNPCDIGASRSLRSQFLEWFLRSDYAHKKLEEQMVEVVGA